MPRAYPWWRDREGIKPLPGIAGFVLLVILVALAVPWAFGAYGLYTTRVDCYFTPTLMKCGGVK